MPRPVPHADRGASTAYHGPERPRPDHVVTFYEHTGYLAASVRPFLLEGLQRGETVLVVATPEHREAFAEALTTSGHDLEHRRRTGRYVELDAATTLAELVPDEQLAAARFEEQIARPVTAMARRRPGLRVYGEMVALLWQRGQLALALELEDRWNALLEQDPFPLFCGYPLAAFDTPETTARFHDVCARHSRVTTDSYSSLVDTPAATGGVVMLAAGEPGGSSAG